MSVSIHPEITGLKELEASFKFIAQHSDAYLSAAAKEALELHVLDQVGLKNYPPATEANRPGRFGIDHKPLGYYQRGIGWWYPVMRKSSLIAKTTKSGGKSYANRAGGSIGTPASVAAGYKVRRTSERYGTKFIVSRIPFGAALGNSASYAKYLGGQGTQSRQQAKYGWRVAYDVANQNMPKINATFDKWIQKLYLDAQLGMLLKGK